MTKTIPDEILQILQLLKDCDEQAFLVGGCVRDMLMKRPLHDYDITTSALPEKTIAIFHDHGYKVVPTGIKHGTISVFLKDQDPVEITTYRLEQEYQDHRHPDTVCFTKDLREDLKRRDFTMNAIAFDPEHGLFDPYHGEADIKQGILRCVGTADDRFQEDALRMLRAVRFQCVLKFQMEETCATAIQTHHALLQYVSKERIREEFNRILLADYEDTLQLLYDSQLLEEILPGYTQLYHHAQTTPWHLYDVFTHTDKALNHTAHAPLENKLAIVFHDWGKIRCETFDEAGRAHYKGHAAISEQLAVTAMKQLRYDRSTIEKVALLIRYHDTFLHEKRSVVRRFLARCENDFAFAHQVLEVQLADDMAKNLSLSQEKIEVIHRCQRLLDQMEEEQDQLSLKDLAINGHDLKNLGLSGKAIGQMLQELYAYVLEEPTRNEKAQLLQHVKEKNS